MTLEETAALKVTDKKVSLPWPFAVAVFTLVFGLGGLTVEARMQLGNLNDQVQAVAEKVDNHREREGHPVLSHRVSQVEERIARAEAAAQAVGSQVARIQRSVDAICIKLNAACPGGVQ